MKIISDLIVKLRLRYNLGREVVTIYIPVFLALMFFTASLYYTGYLDSYLGVKSEGKESVGPSLSGSESLSEMELNKKIEELRKIKEGGGKAEKKDEPLDDIVIFAVMIVIIPYSIDSYLQRRKLRKYEEEFADLLFEIAEMMRSGIDPIKSIKELSKSNLGTITQNVRRATTRMIFAKSFDYSIRKMAAELKSNLIIKYSDLLIHASYTGGQISELMLRSSEDMKKFINLDKEKEGNLKMYVLIFYMAQAVLLFLAAIFMSQVVPSFQGVNVGMFFTNFGANAGSTLDTLQIATYSFHIVMINAFFVGLIAGKMSTGSMKHGLKHSVILMLVSYATAALFIMPQPAAMQEVMISPVSYNSGGYVGISQKEPIIFKVTDPQGKPLEKITVAFKISGPGNGMVTPATALTNSEGIVSMKPTLGSAEGKYTITAAVGEYSSSVYVEARTTD